MAFCCLRSLSRGLHGKHYSLESPIEGRDLALGCETSNLIFYLPTASKRLHL